MTKTYDMKALETITGYTRDGLVKLMARVEFSSDFPTGRQGQRTLYSRENAVELGFVCALLRSGANTADARAIAADWLQREIVGKRPNFWAFNPKDGFSDVNGVRGIPFTDDTMRVRDLHVALSDDSPSGWVGDPVPTGTQRDAAVIVIIDMTEIIRRVDELGEAR